MEVPLEKAVAGLGKKPLTAEFLRDLVTKAKRAAAATAGVQTLLNRLSELLAVASKDMKLPIIGAISEVIEACLKRKVDFPIEDIIAQDAGRKDLEQKFVLSQVETSTMPLIQSLEDPKLSPELARAIIRLGTLIMSSIASQTIMG